MKRLLAFFLAAALTLTSAAGLHFLAERRVYADGMHSPPGPATENFRPGKLF